MRITFFFLRQIDRRYLLHIMLGVIIGTLFSYQKFKTSERLSKTNHKSCRFRDEKKIRILIGVSTSENYLNTKARAVFETWGQTCGSSKACQVVFFASVNSVSNEITKIISLPDIDGDYSPQNKSLVILKYMYDNYIDQFDWFMKVDDDNYLKPKKWNCSCILSIALNLISLAAHVGGKRQTI